MLMSRATTIVLGLLLLVAAVLISLSSLSRESEKDQGLVALRHHNYRIAFPKLEEHLQAQPGDSETRAQLAGGYLSQEEFQKAIRHFGILQDVPDHAENALRSMAAIGMLQKDAGIAEKALTRLLDLKPGDYSASLAFAEFYLETDRPRQSLPFVRHCIAEVPDRAQSYLLLADILNDLGRTAEMIKPLETCIRLSPDDITAHGNLAYAYLEAGKSDSAIREAQWCLERRPDLHAIRLILAKALRDAGDMAEAQVEVHTLIAADSSNLDAAMLQADLLFFWGRGKEVYSLLIGFYDENTENRQLISHLMRAAAALGDIQNLQEFRERLSDLLSE